MSSSRLNFSEVNSTNDNDKYLKNSSPLRRLTNPFSRRAAWLSTMVLSTVSIIPLTGKCILNLANGITDPSSRKEALKNGAAIISAPVIGVISGVSIIFPSWVGGKLARSVVLPIIPAYSSNIEDIQTSAEAFPAAYSLKVKGVNGTLIDSADILYEDNNPSKVERYRIYFNAAGEVYQLLLNLMQEENSQLKCNTRVFNYPGITENNQANSSVDFVNAGIAQVYDIAKKMNWNNSQLQKNLHLSGYCFGGAVALQVAAYFKKNYNIDFLVFVDRSFASYAAAMAGVIHAHSGVPLPLAKAMSASFLHAGGDWDLDSIKAIKTLNPDCVHYINVSSDVANPEQNTISQIKYYLGIGASNVGDGILTNDASLTKALEHEKFSTGQQTRDIFKALDMTNDHWVYAEEKGSGHFKAKNNLATDSAMEENHIYDYYKKAIEVNESCSRGYQKC